MITGTPSCCIKTTWSFLNSTLKVPVYTKTTESYFQTYVRLKRRRVLPQPNRKMDCNAKITMVTVSKLSRSQLRDNLCKIFRFPRKSRSQTIGHIQRILYTFKRNGEALIIHFFAPETRKKVLAYSFMVPN